MWRPRNRIASVGGAIVLTSIAVGAQTADRTRGWTTMFDVTGRCSYAVPPRWNKDDVSDSVNPLTASPDGAVTATVRWSPQPAWRDATAELRATTQPKVVHEDSDRRFWVELHGPAHARVLHVAVTGAPPHGACTLEVDVSDKARDNVRESVADIMTTLTGVH